MINARDALRRAQAEIPVSPLVKDPLFSIWVDAALGEPQLVCDLLKNPSYWVIPVLLQERVIGFIQVLGDGRVARFGAFYRDPQQLGSCPLIVTGISAQEALSRAKLQAGKQVGETLSQPIYVHNGAPGREAWLVETLREGKPSRWIFVTAALIYERPAGEVRPEGLE